MEITKEKIWITGASGFIGTRLVRSLAQAGYDIIALVRDSSKYSNTASIQYHNYNLTAQAQELMTLPIPDYIIHTAYIPYDRDHPQAIAENLSGTAILLEAGRKYNVKKLLFFSSQSAHSDASSSYGKSKFEIESILCGPGEIALRLGLVVGDGSGLYGRIKTIINKSPIVPLIGGGNQPVHLLWDEDLLEIVRLILRSPLSENLLHIAIPQALPIKNLYYKMASDMKKNPRFISLPYWPFDILFWLIALMPFDLGVSTENLDGLKQLTNFSPADNNYFKFNYTPLERMKCQSFS